MVSLPRRSTSGRCSRLSSASTRAGIRTRTRNGKKAWIDGHWGSSSGRIRRGRILKRTTVATTSFSGKWDSAWATQNARLRMSGRNARPSRWRACRSAGTTPGRSRSEPLLESVDEDGREAIVGCRLLAFRGLPVRGGNPTAGPTGTSGGARPPAAIVGLAPGLPGIWDGFDRISGMRWRMVSSRAPSTKPRSCDSRVFPRCGLHHYGEPTPDVTGIYLHFGWVTPGRTLRR